MKSQLLMKRPDMGPMRELAYKDLSPQHSRYGMGYSHLRSPSYDTTQDKEKDYFCYNGAYPRNKPFTSNQHIKNLKSKLTVLSPSGYYEDMPFKPGFYFLEGLICAPRSSISSLQINIPDSLYITEASYLIQTDPSGFVKVSRGVSAPEFLQHLENKYPKPIVAVHRIMGEDTTSLRKMVLDWRKLYQKLCSRVNTTSLIQKHIPFHTRPNVTRLHYFPYSKDNRSNFGYFISSLPPSSIQKWVVNNERPEELEWLKVSGKYLVPFEKEAEKIVVYLNKGYQVRIQEIVLDFLRDPEGCIWFCGCKGFRIDETTLGQKQMNKEVSISLSCNLCRLTYPAKDVNSMVSVRMLVTYNTHASERYELPWDFSHLTSSYKDMLSQTVKICKYCYMLVNSEFELMKAKYKLAEYLNIHTEKESPSLDHGIYEFMPPKLSQWRMLLYFNRIFDWQQPIPKHMYLHVCFNESVTSFKVKSTELNMMKVFYFFSDNTKSVKSVIDSLLTVRFTIGKSFNGKVRGSGEIKLSNMFSDDFPMGNALIETKQIYMFHSEQNNASINMMAGISLDKEVKRSYIKHIIKGYKGVYFVQPTYISSDPLPVQWIEMFETQGVNCEQNKDIKPSYSFNKFARKTQKTIIRSYSNTKKTKPLVLKNTNFFLSKIGNEEVLKRHLAVIKKYTDFGFMSNRSTNSRISPRSDSNANKLI